MIRVEMNLPKLFTQFTDEQYFCHYSDWFGLLDMRLKTEMAGPVDCFSIVLWGLCSLAHDLAQAISRSLFLARDVHMVMDVKSIYQFQWASQFEPTFSLVGF